jgi:hypothetical protein
MKNIRNTNGNSQSPYAVQNYSGSGADNNIVLFDGTSGKLIKNSTVPLYAHNDSFGIGTDSQKLGSTNNSCISLGAFSMNDSQGAQNCVSIGHNSSQLSIDPSNNVVIGFNANNGNLHGSWNTIVGSVAGTNYQDSESYNIILGNHSDEPNKTGLIRIGDGNQNKLYITNIAQYNNNTNNTGFGTYLSNITSGEKNTSCGSISMQNSTTTSNNTAYGFASLGNLVDGVGNTALGFQSGLNYESNESYNILINSYGTVSDVGVIRIGNGDQNKLYIPNIAYYNNNTSNVGFGTDFPNANPSLSICTAVGDAALRNATTASACTATGSLAMQYATTAYNNCA